MLKLNEWRGRLALLAGAISFGGCANSKSQVPEEQLADDPGPGEPGIVVTTNDGVRYEGAGLQLDVREGQMVSAVIAATTPSGVSWTANFYLDPIDAAGSSVQLARMPPKPGIGYVAIRQGDDNATLLAESVGGELTFQLLQGGTVEGEASTQPGEASATFAGKYSLSCWVLPETIGQQQNGSGDGVTLVQDAAMASDFCKQFQHLL